MNSFCLAKANIEANNSCYHFESIRRKIYDNLILSLRQLHVSAAGRTPFADDFSYFSLDGSISVKPEYFETFAPNFFRKSPRRHTMYRGKHSLRGTNYTIASNPTFELRQKLDIIRRDFNDALAEVSSQASLPFQAALADYIKNACITLLNSVLYDEKIGKHRLHDHSYQSLRRAAQLVCESSVLLFYSLLLRDILGAKSAHRLLTSRSDVIDKMCRHIEERYSQGIFSSRHITRPEASHPGIIALSALAAVQKGEVPNLIVGLPSGSTELAIAHKVAWKLIKSREVAVLLMPISLHSAKNDFDVEPAGFEGNIRFVRGQRKLIKGQLVHVIDDNSSTGRTVDLAYRLVMSQAPRSVRLIVAEADLIRTELGMGDPNRAFVASASVYSDSISVLPVSRRLQPRHDLKEVLERRRVAKSIKIRYFGNGVPVYKRVIGESYLALLERLNNSAETDVGTAGGIFGFKGTFLSNFFPVEVQSFGGRYASVEHAYQAMKFSHVSKIEVKDHDLLSINRVLLRRGEQVSHDGISNLFNSGLSSGSSKIVGNYLRRLGYVRSDWDYIKVDIMTLLLLQKFSVSENYTLLRATGNKYLEESNDWGDTFWGVSGNRGRNMLGHLLMRIRPLNHETIFGLARQSVDQLCEIAEKSSIS